MPPGPAHNILIIAALFLKPHAYGIGEVIPKAMFRPSRYGDLADFDARFCCVNHCANGGEIAVIFFNDPELPFAVFHIYADAIKACLAVSVFQRGIKEL